MEELITGLIKGIIKMMSFIIRLGVEFFMDIVQGICEWIIEKCYKKYPKLTITAFVILMVLVVVMVVQIFSVL